jgi:hypothetical protein
MPPGDGCQIEMVYDASAGRFSMTPPGVERQCERLQASLSKRFVTSPETPSKTYPSWAS